MDEYWRRRLARQGMECVERQCQNRESWGHLCHGNSHGKSSYLEDKMLGTLLGMDCSVQDFLLLASFQSLMLSSLETFVI